jgi:hypothetical protein
LGEAVQAAGLLPELLVVIAGGSTQKERCRW